MKWLSYILVSVLFCGCAAPKVQVPPMPPIPEEITVIEPAPVPTRPQPLTVPFLVVVPPPRTVTIAWDRCSPEQISFNVYSSTIPSYATMTIRTNTSNTMVTLPADKPMEFFSVKAVGILGFESDWAIKGPCP